MGFTGEIINCFDSHCHFMGTGQVHLTLNLHGLKDFAELKYRELPAHFFNEKWLTGFGWDQSQFKDGQLPTRFQLDQVFADFPVAFSRADGHALLLNSKALELLPQIPTHLSTQTELSHGTPTGIFYENAKEWVDKQIPSPSRESQKNYLKKACEVFNSAGVTHIRDMTTSALQWELEQELFAEGSLSLAVQHLILCDSPQLITETVKTALELKKTENSQMKIEGIKIFIDGSLGSRTAYLSKNYRDSSSRGLLLWSQKQIADAIHQAWGAKLGIAIHAIGDAAAEQMLLAAIEVKKRTGLNGKIALEHGELLSDLAIQLAQDLDITFHMQPCHFLTDRNWLSQYIDESLMSHLFRWYDVEQINKKIYFGTDSPVEGVDPMRNFAAIDAALEFGIKRPTSAVSSYHHCDLFLPTKKSIFVDSKLVEIVAL